MNDKESTRYKTLNLRNAKKVELKGKHEVLSAYFREEGKKFMS